MIRYPLKDGNIYMCPTCHGDVYDGEEDCVHCGQGIDWKFEGVNPPENKDTEFCL